MDWLIRLIARHPRLVAVFGFTSGLASFFLVAREQEQFAQVISVLMLISWTWLTIENLLRRGVNRWFGIELPEPLLKFATQMVHQESLFFVIPFFVITTTWSTPQAVFTGLLIVAACISVIDPIYYRWLARHRWLYLFFHGFTLFAVLLVALPILVHIPTAKTYVLAVVIAMVLSFLNIVRELPHRFWHRAALAVAVIGITAVTSVLIRQWVPPATLWLTKIAIAHQIDTDRRAPVNKLSVLREEELEQGLYAYTSVHAPRGLHEYIYHVWYLNGQQIDKIALAIAGGRDAGYRAWTRKLNFPPYPSGKWRIDVVTEAGQLIGVLRFQVLQEGSQGPGINSVAEGIAENTGKPYTTPDAAIRTPLFEFIVNEGRELLAALDAEWEPSADDEATGMEHRD